MRKKPEYFILNQERNFRQGCGGRIDTEGLTVTDGYISKVFDSGVKEMRWYKLSLEYEQPTNSMFSVAFYTFESDWIDVDGTVIQLEELIHSERSFEQKCAILQSARRLSVPAAKEILLTQLHGRYLLFTAHLTVAGDGLTRIRSARLFFRPDSLMQYLPEIYQTEDDGFLERYMGIFQSLYEEMEQTIETTYENYTAENADSDFLKWLSSWYGMQTADLWKESQLRYLLKNAARLYRNLGTKDMIEEVCGLYLGERPEIITYDQSEDESFVNSYPVSRDKLFIHPYVFTIVIQNAVLSAAELEKLQKIIDSCKPAHMEVNILQLAGTAQRESRVGQGILVDADDPGSLQNGVILTG